MPVTKEIHFYIDSDWDFKPPVIRIWVDDFLISERAVTPRKKEGVYLEEIVILDLVKGTHKIIIENVKTALAEIKLHKILVDGKVCKFKTTNDIRYEATLKIK